jgi:glycosyltransferase involved in cell wall biosynthesis
MVGTLEPRKAHAQALAAFEALWDGGTDVTLVVAGKAGWMVESLVKRLNQHPERGQRLLWIESATDDELQSLYEASSGVLMASQGEGFGLPLVEAATHRRPILARDLPVFREVAGEHATYFSGLSAASLAAALASWLIALNNGSAPKSDAVRHLTWDESSRWLTEIILEDRWYRDWTSGSNEESPHQNSTSGKPEPNLETTTRSEPPWGAGVPAADHRG